jgi:hypothetical protein
MNNEPGETQGPPPIDEVKFVQGVINLRMELVNELARLMQEACEGHPAKPTVHEIYLALTTSLVAFIEVTEISEIERGVLDSFLAKQLEEHKAEIEQIGKN